MYMYTYIESKFSTLTQQSLKGWFTSFLLVSHCKQKCIWNDLDTRTQCWNGTFFYSCIATCVQIILYVHFWSQRDTQKRCEPAFNAGNSIIKFCLCPSSMMLVVYGEPQIRYTMDHTSLYIVQLLLTVPASTCMLWPQMLVDTCNKTDTVIISTRNSKNHCAWGTAVLGQMHM